jgi:hypothetical protein
MRILGFIFLFVILFFTNCKLSNPYQKQIKELDSLKIVVEEAVDYFNKIDSADCASYLAKQQTYKSFILNNLKDTLTKSEAENIQLMMNLGNPIKEYLNQRNIWLTEAKISISQLQNLNQDLKNNALEPSETVEYINEEKKKAEQIIQNLKTNTELIRKNLELYKSVEQSTESIIKNLNSGNLPTIQQPIFN